MLQLFQRACAFCLIRWRWFQRLQLGVRISGFKFQVSGCRGCGLGKVLVERFGLKGPRQNLSRSRERNEEVVVFVVSGFGLPKFGDFSVNPKSQTKKIFPEP